MLEKAAKAAAAEMQKVEMIDAAPSVIAALQARRVVRAVLLAVREPDDAFPGAYAIGVSGSASDDERARLVFKCMIDAILNEGSTE